MTYNLAYDNRDLLLDALTDPNDERRAKSGEWIFASFPVRKNMQSPFIFINLRPSNPKPISLGGNLYEERAIVDFNVECNREYREGSEVAYTDAHQKVSDIVIQIIAAIKANVATMNTWIPCTKKPKYMGKFFYVKNDMVGIRVSYEYLQLISS